MEKNKSVETAIFSGGCFWGVESSFRKVRGVTSTESGYIGGHTEDPTYEEVCTDATGHAEAVRVKFNPDEVSYEELARLFFEIHDPTQVDRQGADIGSQYRSEIFYTSPRQRETAEMLIEALRRRGYMVVTRLTRAPKFHRAEEYHQNYSEKTGRNVCAPHVKRF
ncbi:MAG: peptide-methionine (S)-S-oxide reductase MsrA [Alistipes sp.]|nr:peptide-methionine (S)-S-oxide reductase MsrA [Alistipes sp.]